MCVYLSVIYAYSVCICPQEYIFCSAGSLQEGICVTVVSYNKTSTGKFICEYGGICQ